MMRRGFDEIIESDAASDGRGDNEDNEMTNSDHMIVSP